MVERQIGGSKLRLVRGDITELEVEAFVFDITEDVKLGSGYGGAIQQRGGIMIQKELDAIGQLPDRRGVVTEAGMLKAEHIIHVNGPEVPRGGRRGQARAGDPRGAATGRGEGDQAARLSADRHRPVPGPAGPVRPGDGRHGRGAPPATARGLEEVLFVAVDTREYEPFEAKI